ncbi:hypothetical protein Tco_0074647 [Tanacetum coccineum]
MTTSSKLPSLIGIRSISKVSIVMGGIFSLEASDMDTKLLSALESNNTLARCWFRRNIPITSIGWPFVSAVLGQMAHLVASITLDSASWGSSISPEGFLSSVLLWLVIIVAIVGVGVTLVVVIIVAVVVVVESSFVVKLSFVIT